MKCRILPTDDRVFVEELPPEEAIGDSGLVKPENTRQRTCVGVIRYANSGGLIGRTVAYSKYSGFEVTLNDEKLLVLKASEIIAFLELL